MALANPSGDTVNTSWSSAMFVALITRLLLLFIASVAAEGHQQSAIGLQSLPFSASRKALAALLKLGLLIRQPVKCL